MIEGLRLLPWLQQSARSNSGSVAHLLNCEKCMTDHPSDVRARLLCGWVEPAPDGRAWYPPGFGGFDLVVDGKVIPRNGATTCPGYTCKLPEVVEASRAHMHWSNGSLRDRVDGRPTAQLMDAIEVLALEQSAVEAHEAAERARKDGR